MENSCSNSPAHRVARPAQVPRNHTRARSTIVNDRVVLVTGGAGNLGHAVTAAFLEAGARVAVPLYKTDRSDTLNDLQARHADRLYTFALDLTTERGAEQAVGQVVEWGGRI